MRKKIIAGFCIMLFGLHTMVIPTQAAPAFDPGYYAATYPDVVAALGTGQDVLLQHYLTYGMKEMRLPYQGAEPGAAVDTSKAGAAGAGIRFDAVYYAATYPDVKAALGTDPQKLLDHYLAYGMAEGRTPYAGAVPGSAVGTGAGTATGSGNAAAKFDPNYYANTYPDVVAALGTDPGVLLNHYLSHGKAEGRTPYAGAAPGAAVEGIQDTVVNVQGTSQFVPVDQLANLKSLRKKMTDEELNAAYNVALEIVKPYAELTREEQLQGIAYSMRMVFEYGGTYSMSEPHYNDPYGYLILGSASCAGCARATGLCLNILGIPYEHVNENQYSHQWCRVEINGTYWICDAFGLYCGPEPAPYAHPYL